MEHLVLTYGVWKTITASQDLQRYHDVELPTGHKAYVWAGNENYFYSTLVRGDDFTDWDDNLKDISSAQNCEADAKALILSYGARHKTVTPTALTKGYNLHLMGCADNPGGSPEKGGGPLFIETVTELGVKNHTAKLCDKTYVIGGHCRYSGAVSGDYASFAINAPKSITAPNGSGTGNCNLSAAASYTAWSSGTSYSGGEMVTHNGINYVSILPGTNQEPPNTDYWLNAANIIVPTAGDGTYDVTLASAVPIPANGEGFWDWTSPDQGLGAISPSANPGKAQWYLFDFEQELNRFAQKIPLLGTDHVPMNIANISPARVCPQWELICSFNNFDGEHTLEVVWFLYTGRKYTVDM